MNIGKNWFRIKNTNLFKLDSNKSTLQNISLITRNRRHILLKGNIRQDCRLPFFFLNFFYLILSKLLLQSRMNYFKIYLSIIWGYIMTISALTWSSNNYLWGTTTFLCQALGSYNTILWRLLLESNQFYIKLKYQIILNFFN